MVNDGDGCLCHGRIIRIADIPRDCDARNIVIVERLRGPCEVVDVADFCEVREFPLGEC